MNLNADTKGKMEMPVCLQAGETYPVECVWMQNRVVNFHLCDTNADCTKCSFDRSMRNFMACQFPVKSRRSVSAWAERMRTKYQGFMKPCVHFLEGTLESYTVCRRNYDCDECPIGLELEYRPMLRDIQSIQ
jgi:hypothetical protein